MGLVEHLRSHFGEDDGDAAAWSFADAGFGIVTYNDQPVRGAVTYLTMGLSHHILTQDSGKSICQELLMSVRADQKGIGPERSLS